MTFRDPPAIGYVVNTYPRPSHSFIRREIRALEAQAGVETRLPAAIPADAAPPDPAQPKAGTLTTPRRKRRTYTPNFMRD